MSRATRPPSPSHPLLRKKNIDDMLAASRGEHGSEHLERSMTTFQLMMFGVGATIGTGIFFVLAVTVPKAGPAVMVTFLLVGIIAALTALCYAEVASTIPVSGSAYSYSFASLGELPAYIVGWCLILEYGVAGAATSVGWAEYFNALLDDVFGFRIPESLSSGLLAEGPGIINLPAVVLVGMCCLLLLRGAKESARANAIMVVIKLCVLALFVVLALTGFKAGNLEPFAPEGISGISAAIPAIFFTFLGIDAVSTAGEEVKDPGRTIPRAVFGAVAIVTVFYLFVAFAAVGAQETSKFEGQDAGLEAILDDVTGISLPGIIIAAGAVISIFSVTLITVYGQTRILFAMGRDGMLPPLFKEVNKNTLSPNKNVLVTSAFIAVLAAVVPIDKLFDLVSIGTLAAFMVVSATVIILRRTRPDLERGFRLPFGPVIPILSIISCAYAASTIAAVTWISVGLWLVLALAVYFLYSHKHSILHDAEVEEAEQ
ncbi:amino acid permease [Streptomyces sp. SID13031]|uniref:amino acid permease n=1 Tax=Streptomyces sp. SID13031 TaxID=2706046 RepID=UPI0013C7C7A5|nr:amino acid permease [Streptomyces sp. SID13031]NEA34904.1 amino acid permease [Streptomyces sp. SID13031]